MMYSPVHGHSALQQEHSKNPSRQLQFKIVGARALVAGKPNLRRPAQTDDPSTVKKLSASPHRSRYNCSVPNAALKNSISCSKTLHQSESIRPATVPAKAVTAGAVTAEAVTAEAVTAEAVTAEASPRGKTNQGEWIGR